MKRELIVMTVCGVLVISALAGILATSLARDPESKAAPERVDSLTSSFKEERAEARQPRVDRAPAAVLPVAPLPSATRAVSPDLVAGSVIDAGTPAGSIAAAVDRPAPTLLTPREVGGELEEVFFTADEKDHAWAREAESVAATKLRDLLPQGSELRSLQCRGSMCRIETMHADLTAYQQFVQSAALDPTTHLWNGGMFSTIVDDAPTPDGRLTTVAYIAREGEPLPTPRAAASSN